MNKSWNETSVMLIALMAIALVGSQVFPGVNNFAFEKGGILLIIIVAIASFLMSSTPQRKDQNPFPFLDSDDSASDTHENGKNEDHEST